MPGGLIGTGIAYEQNALKGFVRSSELQQRIEEENQRLEAQKEMQTQQMIGTGAGIGMAILFAALL